MKRILAATLLVPSLALAAPLTEFKPVPKKGILKLSDCPAIDGLPQATTMKLDINKKGNLIFAVPAKLSRKDHVKKKTPFNLFACGVDEANNNDVVVYGKTDEAGEPTILDLDASNFKKVQGPGKECKVIKELPGSLIWKTVGSHHFPSSDCRRHTAGLVAAGNANAGIPGVVNILASNGKRIGGLGLYAVGGGWYARWYACVKGTDAQSGQSLASEAKKMTGNETGYLDFGSTCFRVPDLGQCVHSKAC